MIKLTIKFNNLITDLTLHKKQMRAMSYSRLCFLSYQGFFLFQKKKKHEHILNPTMRMLVKVEFQNLVFFRKQGYKKVRYHVHSSESSFLLSRGSIGKLEFCLQGHSFRGTQDSLKMNGNLYQITVKLRSVITRMLHHAVLKVFWTVVTPDIEK